MERQLRLVGPRTPDGAGHGEGHALSPWSPCAGLEGRRARRVGVPDLRHPPRSSSPLASPLSATNATGRANYSTWMSSCLGRGSRTTATGAFTASRSSLPCTRDRCEPQPEHACVLPGGAARGLPTVQGPRLEGRRDQHPGRRLASVTSTLNDRDQDLVTIMTDAEPLFAALVHRTNAIPPTARIKQPVDHTALPADHRQPRRPLPGPHEPPVGHTRTHQGPRQPRPDTADPRALLLFRLAANVLGNGPWIDAYVANLPPVPQA